VERDSFRNRVEEKKQEALDRFKETLNDIEEYSKDQYDPYKILTESKVISSP